MCLQWSRSPQGGFEALEDEMHPGELNITGMTCGDDQTDVAPALPDVPAVGCPEADLRGRLITSPPSVHSTARKGAVTR